MSSIRAKLGIAEFCYYCSKKLSRKNFSVDHKKPLSKGGLDKPGNKVHSCTRCNTDKGCLTLDEFRAVWAYRLRLVKPTFLFPGEIANIAKRKIKTLTF